MLSLTKIARTLSLAALLMSSAGSMSAARGQAGGVAPDSLVRKVMLADGIYLFMVSSELDQWTATNSVVIINEKDVTVFDSNTRPSTTRRILAEIRRMTDKPVRTLVNSHWHMDHWSGNEVYAAAFPGLQIIATSETRDFMRMMPPAFFVRSIGVEGAAARLDTMILTGKRPNGRPFTTDDQRRETAALDSARSFAAEMASVTHVLPTIAFHDSLVVWSGSRQMKLFSVTGDASGSTIMFLPKERILITGDAVVLPERGPGAQPWTTNSYKITPWLESLRMMASLDPAIIVPGQGPAQHDKTFLNLTIALFDSIITQVHAALEGGASTVAEVQQRVNLDRLKAQMTNGDAAAGAAFQRVTTTLIRRVWQEARDGLQP